jgi:hypothetical protein
MAPLAAGLRAATASAWRNMTFLTIRRITSDRIIRLGACRVVINGTRFLIVRTLRRTRPHVQAIPAS